MAYPEEWADLIAVLREFRLLRSDIGELAPRGVGKSLVAIRMDHLFRAKGWEPKEFDTERTVTTTRLKAQLTELIATKQRLRLELEWNNKTEFYDRDLNNFRLLFELRVADVGITQPMPRTSGRFRRPWQRFELRLHNNSSPNFNASLDGGAGGGCPVLAIGMRKALYVDDITDRAWATIQADRAQDAKRSKVSMSEIGDDLLRFAGKKKFKTVLAYSPWRFINRTGKYGP